MLFLKVVLVAFVTVFVLALFTHPAASRPTTGAKPGRCLPA